MDFGIARLTEKVGQTAEGISGTPEYMSPEQARAREVDARADLYSLGCVLYHMLAGAIPFPAATPMAAALRHVEDPAPDPRAAAPTTPPWLAKLVLALLEKDPARRPQTANAVLALLAGPKRRSLVVPVTIAATIAIAAVIVALAWPRSHTAPPPTPEWKADVKDFPPAFDENSDVAAWSPDGKVVAYVSDREATGFFRIYLQPVDHSSPPRAITPHGLDVNPPTWAQDGRTLLARTVIGGAPTIVRIPVEGLTGSLERIAIAAHGVECGGQIVLALYERIWALDRGHEREILHTDPSRFVSGFACDSGTRQIVFMVVGATRSPVHAYGDLYIVPLAGGAPRQLTHDGSSLGIAIAPDGHHVVTSRLVDGKTNLWEVSVDSGAMRQLTFDDGPDLAPSISPDGSKLMFNEDTTSLAAFAIDTTTGVATRLSSALEDLQSPMLAPDGRTLIATAYRGTDAFVITLSLTNGEERTLARGSFAIPAPDGRDVIFVDADDRSRLDRVAIGGGAPRTLATLSGEASLLSTELDGTVHVSVDAQGSWRIPLDGAPVREASSPWCLVTPAPNGWRLVMGCDLTEHLVPPGVAYDDPKVTAIPADPLPAWDATATGVIYREGADIMHIDAATGTKVRVVAAPPLMDGINLSPDGKTIYTTYPASHIRRKMIVNFGDRPPLP
jgi:Tol biopolymer transport system component